MLEQGDKQPNPQEASHPEVSSMNIVRRAELLAPAVMPSVMGSESYERELEGRTVEQIAREPHDPRVFGIRTFRRVEGTVIVDGKPINVSSCNFDNSGITYIDGQIMTVNEVKRTAPDKRTLISNMEHGGWEKVIKARNGVIHRFSKGDSNVVLPKQGK